jgi:hypothetical protein
MGLSSHYRQQQKHISAANKKLCVRYNHTKSLNKIIPGNLLLELFPFILLFLSGDSFRGVILASF